MRSVRRSLVETLRGEEREVRRRITALRRQRSRWVGPPDLPADGSLNMFEVALRISAEQHEEVLRRRLAEKSQALAEAMEQIREGTYGMCRECGCRTSRVGGWRSCPRPLSAWPARHSARRRSPPESGNRVHQFRVKRIRAERSATHGFDGHGRAPRFVPSRRKEEPMARVQFRFKSGNARTVALACDCNGWSATFSTKSIKVGLHSGLL